MKSLSASWLRFKLFCGMQCSGQKYYRKNQAQENRVNNRENPQLHVLEVQQDYDVLYNRLLFGRLCT